MVSYGAFLKYLRKSANLTQDEVAARLNIVTPVLSKWENDKSVPDISSACKLCNIFGISIEELLAREKGEFVADVPPENYDGQALGRRIKSLRQNNGWSQSDVGKKLFVTSQTVSKWEIGGVSTLALLQSLADVYGVKPSELLTESVAAVEEDKEINLSSPVTGGAKVAADSAHTAVMAVAESRLYYIKAKMIVVIVILLLLLMLGGAGLITGTIYKQNNLASGNDLVAADEGIVAAAEVITFSNPVKKVEISNRHADFIKSESYDMYYGHSGIDFVTKSGTYVYAVGDGVVESIVLDYTGAVVVLIDHGNGFKSEYTYIDPSDYIFEGATVKEGDRIGFVTEPYGMERFDDYHLHFELFKDGESIDPSEYLNIT